MSANGWRAFRYGGVEAFKRQSKTGLSLGGTPLLPGIYIEVGEGHLLGLMPGAAAALIEGNANGSHEMHGRLLAVLRAEAAR